MATESQRQKAANLLKLFDEWPYYPLEAKLYAYVYIRVKRLRKHRFMGPVVNWLIVAYHNCDTLICHVGEALDRMPKAKQVTIILACLVASAGIVFLASRSWVLALVIGMLIALPVGYWLGRNS